ncbi:MAG TPA: hypothetical protein VF101_03900 [Gaiellaceae bacterium]
MASTTPPDRPGPNWNLPEGARLPLPGNAEAFIWIVALIVAAIVVAIADKITNVAWFDYFKWTTVAYLLSRGIAKASRVLEQ